MSSNFWSDERKEDLKRLWDDGHSVSVICNMIGAPSRNAVQGKADRMGLPSRRPTPYRSILSISEIPTAERRRATRPNDPIQALHFAPVPPEARSGVRCAVEGLTTFNCKWPIGDPREPGFHFCMQPSGGQYCPEHHAIAFTAPQPRRVNR